MMAALLCVVAVGLNATSKTVDVPRVHVDLTAEPGVFGEFEQVLDYQYQLSRLLAPEVYRVAQTMFAPSKDAEKVVFLDFPSSSEADKRCDVVYRYLNAPLRPISSQLTGFGPRLQDKVQLIDLRTGAPIKVAERRAKLSRAVCDALDDLWRLSLVQAKPAQDVSEYFDLPGRIDAYHFASWQEGPGYRGAFVIHPAADTLGSALIEIATLLIAYTSLPEPQRAQSGEEINRKAGHLQRVLQVDRQILKPPR